MTRINTGSIAAALDTLHGARKLPPTEAIERLQSFSDTISPPGHESKFAADASAALKVVTTSLEVNGSASDDAWQHAIETMTTLANNPE